MNFKILPQLNLNEKNIQSLPNKTDQNKQNTGENKNNQKKLSSSRINNSKIALQQKTDLINDYSQVLYFSNQIRKITIQKYDQQKKQKIACPVTNIIAHGKMSAVSDNQGNLWILGIIFPYPINLSQVLKKKIIDSFLGQKGIILKTKKNFYVVNWDKISFPKQILKKICVDKKYQDFFQCWEEIIPYRSDAKFLFCSKKDSFSECYYHIFSQKLIIYPLMMQININKKIKGISVSKTHTLCWTSCGKLFSWGQKTLALGYTEFSQNIQAKQINNINFQVISAVAGVHYSIALSSDGELFEWGIKKVWSKKTNSQSQQFIFTPRFVQIKHNSRLQKVACLKGNENHFGFITFVENFYVWGSKIPQKILQFDGKYVDDNDNILIHNQTIIDPTKYLFQPTLCKFSLNIKVLDFEMRQDYVFLIVANKKSKLKNKFYQQFWSHRLKDLTNHIRTNKIKKQSNKFEPIKISYSPDNKIKQLQNPFRQLSLGKQNENSDKQRKGFGLKKQGHRKNQSALQVYTNDAQEQKQKIEKYIEKLNKPGIHCQDKLTKIVNERISKEQYFKSIYSQQQMFKGIMKQSKKTKEQQQKDKLYPKHFMIPKNNKLNFTTNERKFRNKTLQFRNSQGCENEPIQSEKTSLFRNKIKMHQQIQIQKRNQQILSKIVPIDHQRIQYLLKTSPFQQQKQRNRKLYEAIKQKRKYDAFYTTSNSRTTSPCKQYQELYNLKLTQVLSKKQSISNDFFQSTIQKIQRSSIQFRRKQSQQTAARKQREQRHNLLKESLFQYIIKSYAVKCLTCPLQFGRQTKIQIFARNLKYNRIQKSVRRLFATTRIRFDVQILKDYMPVNYLKLIIIYKNFVKKWRESKRKRLIKYCVQQSLILNLKNKIKIGIEHTRINTKNLQKIGSWMQLAKQQKIKCLNTIWKRHLIELFNVDSQYEPQYNSLNLKSQIKSFKQLYLQKVRHNPLLKIQNYLGVSPLFKVKMLKNFQNMMYLMLKKQESSQQTTLIYKPNQTSKRNGIRFKTKQKQQQQQKFDLKYYVQSQNCYLLPYSKHLQIFKKPKHLQININENIKFSQKWIQQEKKVINRIFSKIIKTDLIQYDKKMYKYRRQMALFIRDNYVKICEKRWKYIIEYNQLKINRDQREIKKKEKQLRKLLRTIGCQSLLKNDILPQKHRILDEAKQLNGAPVLPQKWMTFTANQFKKAFKEYFQTLQSKTKQIKKSGKTNQNNQLIC